MNKTEKHIKNQIKKSLNLNISEHVFSFDSSLNTRVFGSFFHAALPKKNICILMYHGLGAHTHTKGYIELAEMWTQQGFDVIGIDMRHQGGMTTGYPVVSNYGLYTSGFENEFSFYYLNLYVDSYLLVEVAKKIFPNAIYIANGGSQGGALALICAALHKDITLCIADMPSNTDINYLMHHSQSGFKDFKQFIHDHPSKEKYIYDMLNDVDVLSYAHMINVPTLLSSGTEDQVCPTITTKKLYHLLTCKKDLILYEGYGHGGYDHLHFPKKLDFILKNVE